MLVNIFDNMIREDKAALYKCSDSYFCQAWTLLMRSSTFSVSIILDSHVRYSESRPLLCHVFPPNLMKV